MKNLTLTVLGIVGILLLLFISGAIYVVPEIGQVVITQFGQPMGLPKTEAGLHFKVPFIQQVHLFDKRLLEWDGDPNQIPTRDKKYIWVDTTARWRIIDALQFLRSVGSERGAHARLDDIINSATRDIITSYQLVESIRDSNRLLESEKSDDSISMAEEALEEVKSGRQKLELLILKRASELAPKYGIGLVDVRIKRIDYVEDVKKKVYERMISERNRAAEQYRSEGRGRSAEILGEMEKELKLIESDAYRKAQSIRGGADAEAITIYADAYSRDPDFYAFMKTLETYSDTVDSNTRLIFTTDTEYFKYLKKQQ